MTKSKSWWRLLKPDGPQKRWIVCSKKGNHPTVELAQKYSTRAVLNGLLRTLVQITWSVLNGLTAHHCFEDAVYFGSENVFFPRESSFHKKISIAFANPPSLGKQTRTFIHMYIYKYGAFYFVAGNYNEIMGIMGKLTVDFFTKIDESLFFSAFRAQKLSQGWNSSGAGRMQILNSGTCLGTVCNRIRRAKTIYPTA